MLENRSVPIGEVTVEGRLSPRSGALRLSGVRAVESYSDSEIVLAVRGGTLTLTGFRLTPATFSDRAAEVGGRIVSFVYR